MCLIIFSPTGCIPKTHLKRGLKANPDGWGYMFSHAGKLVVRKGMEPKAFWHAWKADGKGKGLGPVVWHARLGNTGTIDEGNCHPFPVKGHGLAVAHNGTIHRHVPGKGIEQNDTQLFIAEILEKLPKGFLYSEVTLKLLSVYIGRSKLAFMDAEGNVEIINEDLGDWYGGRWYSNDGWMPEEEEEAPKAVQTGANDGYTLYDEGGRFVWRCPGLD